MSGVKLAFPAHPDGADAATQSYVETLAKYLKQNDGRMKLSVLGIKCKRPSHIKFGKILEMYQKWFKRSGAKGAAPRHRLCRATSPARHSPVAMWLRRSFKMAWFGGAAFYLSYLWPHPAARSLLSLRVCAV